MKHVQFLDIQLDMSSGTVSPYMKPNDKPLYVHSSSNHPKSILNNIPLSVNRRLSSISSNEDIFKQAAIPYQEALEKSGYEHKLKYQPNSEPKRKRNRSRNIIWFNPPFSQNVKTPVGRKVLQLIDSCFKSDNSL